MSYEIEVVKLRDILDVAEVTKFLEDVEEPTLELKGLDLSSAGKVLINDRECPQFVIVNKGTIWAQGPSGLKIIESIRVIGTKFSKVNPASDVDFEIGTIPRRVRGTLRLAQQFLMLLLQTPGSDVFNPELGGGLQSITNGAANTSTKITSAVTQAVNDAAEQMRRAQMGISNLSASERLLDASIQSISVSSSTSETHLKILIESVGGEDVSTGVNL